MVRKEQKERKEAPEANGFCHHYGERERERKKERGPPFQIIGKK